MFAKLARNSIAHVPDAIKASAISLCEVFFGVPLLPRRLLWHELWYFYGCSEWTETTAVPVTNNAHTSVHNEVFSVHDAERWSKDKAKRKKLCGIILSQRRIERFQGNERSQHPSTLSW